MAYVPGHFDGKVWVKGHEAHISGVGDHIRKTGKLPNPPVKSVEEVAKEDVDHIRKTAETFHVEHPLTGQTMKTVEVPEEAKPEDLEARVAKMGSQLEALMGKLEKLVG
jgi:hypothetical protein